MAGRISWASISSAAIPGPAKGGRQPRAVDALIFDEADRQEMLAILRGMGEPPY